ncbi:metallophosphoesterase [Oceaniovalibus sp. ACAM 378]|uniref:metallophosphoesterase n=1 Tax=Oceaniovalibus sp. ACAM 378 TaxID=2599923 RepID=UPI0011D8F105|nr:metallophosphoesterase [Oceaniovalibus sp. ACAM 378]TYB83402.1 metallophosphoesterase [Oceaniovalibus sp. ACAM 378]
MKKWYTADTHFGHKNIINHCNRPFESADEMDAVLLKNLREAVGPEDQLWIIGDFAFGRKAKNKEWVRSIFDQLPGAEKHLVVGNHDKDSVLELPWTSITDTAAVQDGSEKKWHTLYHYPLITWNNARRGSLNLFGHVHNNWPGSRNSVNVGVDLWDFKPVQFSEIEKRAATLPINPIWATVEPGAVL